MICTGSDYNVEKYPDYRNRVFERHRNKVKNIRQQIKDCSLKDEDKKKLIKELIDLFNQ